MKLDLGCGQNKREGFFGIDVSKGSSADVIYDLRMTPWLIGQKLSVAANDSIVEYPRYKLNDDSVDEVFSSHFFEHLSGPERMPFMDEMWRGVKTGAKAAIITPLFSPRPATPRATP